MPESASRLKVRQTIKQFSRPPPVEDSCHIKQVGAVLLSKQALPFEVITVVLLIAIIGSLLNAREED